MHNFPFFLVLVARGGITKREKRKMVGKIARAHIAKGVRVYVAVWGISGRWRRGVSTAAASHPLLACVMHHGVAIFSLYVFIAHEMHSTMRR